MYEECRKANVEYARTFDRSKLAMPPAKHLAIVACMDARLTVEEFLGLRTGDAHIIRNAGGLATEDAIRSLIISTHLLGTREIIVVNHTDCGMLTFQEDAVRQQLREKFGADAAGLALMPFSDLHANDREQVRKIRECPFIPKEYPIFGTIYHVESGELEEVCRL